MARQEVYARVLATIDLAEGWTLHPGQSLDATEMAVLGETVAEMMGRGEIELRQRLLPEASGILDHSVLLDAIERDRGELDALRRALDYAREGGSTPAGCQAPRTTRPSRDGP